MHSAAARYHQHTDVSTEDNQNDSCNTTKPTNEEDVATEPPKGKRRKLNKQHC